MQWKRTGTSGGGSKARSVIADREVEEFSSGESASLWQLQQQTYWSRFFRNGEWKWFLAFRAMGSTELWSRSGNAKTKSVSSRSDMRNRLPSWHADTRNIPASWACAWPRPGLEGSIF